MRKHRRKRMIIRGIQNQVNHFDDIRKNDQPYTAVIYTIQNDQQYPAEIPYASRKSHFEYQRACNPTPAAWKTHASTSFSCARKVGLPTSEALFSTFLFEETGRFQLQRKEKKVMSFDMYIPSTSDTARSHHKRIPVYTKASDAPVMATRQG